MWHQDWSKWLEKLMKSYLDSPKPVPWWPGGIRCQSLLSHVRDGRWFEPGHCQSLSFIIIPFKVLHLGVPWPYINLWIAHCLSIIVMVKANAISQGTSILTGPPSKYAQWETESFLPHWFHQVLSPIICNKLAQKGANNHDFNIKWHKHNLR